jgi:hypothetical protein
LIFIKNHLLWYTIILIYPISNSTWTILKIKTIALLSTDLLSHEYEQSPSTEYSKLFQCRQTVMSSTYSYQNQKFLKIWTFISDISRYNVEKDLKDRNTTTTYEVSTACLLFRPTVGALHLTFFANLSGLQTDFFHYFAFERGSWPMTSSIIRHISISEYTLRYTMPFLLNIYPMRSTNCIIHMRFILVMCFWTQI